MGKRLVRVAARGANPTLACLLILATLTGSVGFPMVAYAPKDRSRPFPCQDHACGCRSAEECWKHCCCFTNREKLAWARKHGVTPPAFVAEAAENEAAESAHGCCGHRAGCHACAGKKTTQHCDGACGKMGEAAPPRNKAANLKSTLVLVDLARRCKGLARIWALAATGLPPRVDPGWSFDSRTVGRVVERPSFDPMIRLAPPVPPPKLPAHV